MTVTSIERWHLRIGCELAGPLDLPLDGAVDLVMADGSTTELRSGDTFVQIAGRHAWRNRSGSPAKIAILTIGVDA